MSCDCIETISLELQAESLVLRTDASAERVALADLIDARNMRLPLVASRRRRLVARYCPFCGQKYGGFALVNETGEAIL